jgi:hypothetical protein
MILKINCSGKWHYYDNVNNIEKENITCVQKTSDGSPYLEVIDACNYSGTDFLVEDEKTDREMKCKRITYKRPDGTVGYIVYNSTAYLLNDFGKTIDRL